MTRVYLSVGGPGFDSTSLSFVRSRASQTVGSDGRVGQKTELGPVQTSAAFQTRADCDFLKRMFGVLFQHS